VSETNPDVFHALNAPPARSGELAQPVCILAAETPLAVALLHLSESSNGAVLAESGGEYVGILSERSAVELTLRGLQYERMLGEVCSPTLLWANAADSYVVVYERMVSRGLRHALIRDEAGGLIGILSETAILQRMGIEHFAHLDALDQIMTPAPVTLPASANVQAALRAMRESQIGCVVVNDAAGAPIGILTTRDATRLLAHHTALDITRIESVMSHPVVALDAGSPVVEAVRLMATRHFRHVVITRDGLTCGILSEHDIVRCLEHRYVDVLRRLIEHQASELDTQRQVTAQSNLLDQLLSRTGELGLCRIEANGTIRFINGAALELLGRSASERPGGREALAALIAEADRAAFDALIDSDCDNASATLRAASRTLLVRACRSIVGAAEHEETLLILVDNELAREAGEWLGFSRHAFSAMSLPMLWADARGDITMRNRAFDAMIGHTPDGPLRANLVSLVTDPTILTDAPDPDAAIRARTELVRVDGSRIPVELFFTRMRFRDGHYLGGFIHDLSHQAKVEHALQDTEQRLATLLHTSPDFIAVKTPDSRWIMANNAGLRMYGLETAPWQGQTNEALAQLVPPHLADMLRRCTNTDRLAWARREPVRYIDELPRVDASGVRHLDMLKTPIFDEQQRPKALMVIGRDISERMQAERARREADGRLLSALAGMDDLMLIVNNERVVRDHYPKPAPARFHLDHGQLIGASMDQLLPTAAVESLQRAQAALADGRGVQSFDYPLPTAQDTCWFNVRISLHKHLEGGSRGMTLMIRDITASRQTTNALDKLRESLEERVSQRTAELEAALIELESFSYSLSHDLRAPLRAIAGFSRLLDSDMIESLPPEGHDYLARIRSAVGRMDGLIDDMLDLARLSRKPLHREAVDISQMARRIAEELDERNPERPVIWEIAPGLSASADPLLLHSVLDNLLGNAWKFTRNTEPALIRVFSDTEGDTPRFVVEDNGAGFDMVYADKLFKPFQRLHSPRDFDGNGIGLATVERIIRRHGGHIEGESPEHGGAVFRFTLGA